MTREEIFIAPAGRELDALVAEKVMGFRREKTPPDYDGSYGGEDVLVPPSTDHETWKYPSRGRIALTFFVPRYSTDFTEAWELIANPEIMDKYQLGLVPTSFGQWMCRSFMLGYEHVAVQGVNPAEAICKAVLLAKLNMK